MSNSSTIFGAFSNVTAAPETLGTVGNSCSPAKRPENKLTSQTGRKTAHTSFWSANKNEPSFQFVSRAPFDNIDGVQFLSRLLAFDFHWIDSDETNFLVVCWKWFAECAQLFDTGAIITLSFFLPTEK